MTSEISKNETTPAQRNRVTLSNEALVIIEKWLVQINVGVYGVNVKRNELVDWLILNRKKTLSNKEIKLIGKRFFDQVAFTTWALKEYKASKKRGEATQLSDFLNKRPDVASSALQKPSKGEVESSSKTSFPSEKALNISEKVNAKTSNS